MGLIEENVFKQRNLRIRKFPGATVDELSYDVHSTSQKLETPHCPHIGTNDTTRSTPREFWDKLLELLLLRSLLLKQK